jgi:ubiquitin C-terminal hydrolase
MNVTLQCLSNTKDINNYFLKKYKYKKNDENKKISNEFYIIIKNL